VNLATTTHSGRDVSLTTLAENVRAVTRDVRRATERIERHWDLLSPEQKRDLYELALKTARMHNEVDGRAEVRLFSMKGLYLRLFDRKLLRVIEDAEDAVFWFTDAIFDRVETEAPQVQAMMGERLATARADANLREHGRVDA
jgi:hypothetical protein